MNDQAPHANPAGYLARLVERVTPSEPTLRRRQPALFEGAHSSPAAPAQDTLEPILFRASPSPNLAEPAAPMRPGHAAHLRTDSQAFLAPTQSQGPPTLTAAVIPAALPLEAPQVDSTVRTVMPDVPARAVTAPVPASTVAWFAVPVPASPSESPPSPGAALRQPALASHASPTAQPPHSPRQDHDALPGHNRAVAPPSPMTSPTPNRPTATSIPAPAATAPLRPTPAPTLAPRQAVRRQAATTPQPAHRSPKPELPPIEVTIGRIEVRAVPGAQAPPRRSATAPQLSLDQYLRDRGGQR